MVLDRTRQIAIWIVAAALMVAACDTTTAPTAEPTPTAAPTAVPKPTTAVPKPTTAVPKPTTAVPKPTTAVVTDFVVPFEYAIPVGSAIRPPNGEHRYSVAWIAGPDVAPDPVPENGDPGMRPDPWNQRGVIMGSGEAAWSHGNGGRFVLRTAPAEFLADLRDQAHVPMSAIAETTLDGRPALMVALPGTSGSLDIHVSGPMQGLSQEYLSLDLPSRLIVSEIDGTTVFVLIWARTADDLAAWLATADGFVASFHFPEVQS